VVVRLERGADLHMAQLMPLPLTVSCFNKIPIGFTTGMGDRLRAGIPSRVVTSQIGQLSLASLRVA